MVYTADRGFLEEKQMKLTLMSYNVQHFQNFLTKEIDFGKIAEVIRCYDADIIGLNEVRNQGEREDYQAQARILAEILGYHFYFAKAIDVDGPNPYGNALLSRFPILSAQTVMIPDPEVPKIPEGYYETRCLLKAKIDVPGGLNVCVTHFGLNPDEQENAAAVVLENIEEKRCVLMGDFNITPENELLKPIRERMYDTAQLMDADVKSWPSDIPEMKIDYLFTSSDLKVISAEITAVLESDHRPYVVVTEI